MTKLSRKNSLKQQRQTIIWLSKVHKENKVSLKNKALTNPTVITVGKIVIEYLAKF